MYGVIAAKNIGSDCNKNTDKDRKNDQAYRIYLDCIEGKIFFKIYFEKYF